MKISGDRCLPSCNRSGPFCFSDTDRIVPGSGIGWWGWGGWGQRTLGLFSGVCVCFYFCFCFFIGSCFEYYILYLLQLDLTWKLIKNIWNILRSMGPAKWTIWWAICNCLSLLRQITCSAKNIPKGELRSKEICGFFLGSCESVMYHNDSLNVLNDRIENQKLTAKQPEQLSIRWNWKARLYQQEHRRFPSFNYFVTFLTMEASIATH